MVKGLPASPLLQTHGRTPEKRAANGRIIKRAAQFRPKLREATVISFWVKLLLRSSRASRLFPAKFERCRLEISRRCLTEDVPGISRIFGARRRSHAIDLHRLRAHGCRHRIQLRRLQWSKSSKGEERYVGYSSYAKFVDERIIVAVRNIV